LVADARAGAPLRPALRPLRILQLYPKADFFTGAAIQMRDLARGLAARGHHVIVSTRPSEIWAAQCAEAGLPYQALGMRSEIDLRSAFELVRLLRAQRIQVVHAQKGKARTLALLAGLFVRIPVLVLNRGVSFPLDRFNRLGYRIRRVTAIIAVCESIKRGLVAQGVPAEKIEVIYSGTDTDRFHPSVDRRAVRHELGLAPDDFLVTQVGVRSWRGNDDVLDAMAKVVPRLPRARLLIVGANDEKRRILGEKARARGLGGALSVFGYRQDVPEILAATDVSVDASYAGLGLTGSLRESLAVATPVVATRIEGNPELVAHGEHGLLVPPRDPSTLADAVLEMAVAGPDRRQAMGMAGRRIVEARFSMAVKIARTEALYRRVLQ